MIKKKAAKFCIIYQPFLTPFTHHKSLPPTPRDRTLMLEERCYSYTLSNHVTLSTFWKLVLTKASRRLILHWLVQCVPSQWNVWRLTVIGKISDVWLSLILASIALTFLSPIVAMRFFEELLRQQNRFRKTDSGFLCLLLCRCSCECEQASEGGEGAFNGGRSRKGIVSKAFLRYCKLTQY